MRPCLDCGKPSPGSRCEPHRLAHERTRRPGREARGYGPEWRRISTATRAAHPYCSRCGSRDNLHVDHVRHGTLTAGVRVLCASCHGAIGDRRDRPGIA